MKKELTVLETQCKIIEDYIYHRKYIKVTVVPNRPELVMIAAQIAAQWFQMNNLQT